jgi:murein L,D-transpeptidase YcbB/YkuD
VGHPGRFVRLICCIAALSACSRRVDERALAAQRDAVREALGRRPPYVANDKRSKTAWDETRRFYDERDDALIWSDGRTLNARVDSLAHAIRTAPQDGLDPADYQLGGAAFDPAHAADFDLRETYAYFRYAADLKGEADPSPALREALGSSRIDLALQKLTPHSPQYAGLKRHLAACLDDKCRQTIATNMDRWRALPDDLGSRYLIVNIPAFRLEAIEDGQSVLEMKVVTGRKDNPTPVLGDTMTTIVFSPYWNIPDDIVSREILPKLEHDPDYLERSNIEAGDNGHYRQRPGRGNSLGGVKFVFPNHFNVYLHDTPSKNLFERVERDFSHGCVRVEQPLELAKYVLRDQPEWTEQRIRSAMASGVEQSVPLKHKLPIYLVYFTAWDENGTLRTAEDVYGHDRRGGAATAAGP